HGKINGRIKDIIHFNMRAYKLQQPHTNYKPGKTSNGSHKNSLVQDHSYNIPGLGPQSFPDPYFPGPFLYNDQHNITHPNNSGHYGTDPDEPKEKFYTPCQILKTLHALQRIKCIYGTRIGR